MTDLAFEIDRTYVLTIFEAPKSVNHAGGGVRQHWSKARKEKRRWQDRFLLELMVARVRKGMSFCAVEIEVQWKHRNRRDVENYRHPIVKPLLDALVEGGYLEDDTSEFVRVTDLRFAYPERWPYKDPRLKGMIVIRLEAVYA